MRYAAPGRRTLKVELANVSPRGLWLLLDDREVFVPFREFPWFAKASIEQLAAVERPSENHLYWPLLDVDLAVDSLDHPNRYPLISRDPAHVRATPHARVAERRTR
jgi:hypothetical protein